MFGIVVGDWMIFEFVEVLCECDVFGVCDVLVV